MMENMPLICKVEGGFYPIDPPPAGTTPQQWAEKNGKLNAHVIEIQDIEGNVLWTRKN